MRYVKPSDLVRLPSGRVIGATKVGENFIPHNMACDCADCGYARHLRMIQTNPSVSDWLKAALTTADKRDIVDALADAEALLGALQAKYEEITKGETAC